MDSLIAGFAARVAETQQPRRLGPKQIAWIEEKIPNVKYCAAAVAARDDSADRARKLAMGRAA